MLTNRKRFWNRKYIINPKFQWNFVISMLLLSIFIVAFLYATNYILIWKFFCHSNMASLVSADTYEKIQSTQYSIMNYFFIITTVIISIILTVAGILISHKIAGPMFRLKRHMHNISNGDDISMIKFRKNDHFHDIAQAYNVQLLYITQLKDKVDRELLIKNSPPRS